MKYDDGTHRSKCVALLAEGVDRNVPHQTRGQRVKESPSSRRAWIEIPTLYSCLPPLSVALLAEGVDRNDILRR